MEWFKNEIDDEYSRDGRWNIDEMDVEKIYGEERGRKEIIKEFEREEYFRECDGKDVMEMGEKGRKIYIKKKFEEEN